LETYPVLAVKSVLKNNPRSSAWMARNLHLFAYFMKNARSILRCTADEIWATATRKNFLIFF